MADILTQRLQDQASAIFREFRRIDARIDALPTGGGSGVSDGDKGDIVISSSGTVYSLDSGVVTTFARTLLDDADASAVRSTLGLGTAATASSSAFEAAITAGTTGQYWRGDKSFQTLDKAAVGLGNVDNTSDAGKPVSTAQATAIAAKLNASAVSAYGLTLIDDADAATARSTLGLGTAAVAASGDFAAASHTQAASTISDFTEASQDVIGAMVTAAGGSYDDTAGTITLPATSVDYTDPTVAQIIVDDFYPGSGETGEIGAINWSFTNGTIFANAPEANNPGIVGLRTSATANQVCSMYLGSNASATVIRFDQLDHITWLFKPTATNTDCAYQFGAMAAFTALTTTHGCWLERLSTDTNWFFVCANGSTQTRVDSGVAFAASWFKIKIRRHSSTDVRFSLNGAAEVAITTNIPDAADGLNVGNQRTGTTTTTRDVLLDFFSMKALAQTR